MAPAQHSTIQKIHTLHIASGDLWAGAEVMLYTLAKSLHSDLGVKTTIILLNSGTLEQKCRDCGIAVHVIDESQFNSLQIFKQLNKIIRQTMPDVIHTHRIKENILGSIAARLNGIPSIRTTHGAPESKLPLVKLPKHLINFSDWLLARYCQRNIIAVSPDLAEILKQKFPASKVITIANGIDTESLKRSIPASTTNSNGHYHIGIAGRLTPVKRVDLFINSAIYLKKHHSEFTITFHIYGDGPLHDSLQTQIQLHQAESYIQLEGHCDNINQKLQGLDALVMTSDHEGLPMILLEAMCLQVPIIAHAVGGIPFLLDQGQCGTLVTKHTPEAFANAITLLINESAQQQQLTQQAFERVNQQFSAKSTAEAYLKVYKHVSDA